MRIGRDVRRAGPGPVAAVGAAGVVFVLAAAALLLRPSAPLLSKGAGPLGGSPFLTVALALAWAAGWLVVVRRLRSRIRGDRGRLSPREDRLRQVAVPLLLVGPVALAVLALVLHRFPARTDHAPAAGPRELPVPSLPTPSPSAEGSDDGSGVPLSVVAAGLAVALLVIVVVLLAIRLRRYGLSLPAPPVRPAAGEDTERELLLSVVAEGRRALADGTDARAAVIACYAAMEDALAASGVPRRAADSPADLLIRASRAGLAGPAAPRLTALFREARYSSHPMDDSRRVAAAEALEEIAGPLRERRAPEDPR